MNNARLNEPAIDLQKIPILTKKIIFSDEADFDLGGYVYKQNCRILGIENPHTYIEKPTHPKRVTVCSSKMSNGDPYWAMIKEFFFTKIEEEDVGNI